jgi:hypothetical protein
MLPRSGDRGQASVFVVVMLFVLILFVAVVVDVGQAVNRRIALQLVADAGAYTGASTMAVGLNNITYWNRAIQEAWAEMTRTTLGFSARQIGPGTFLHPPCIDGVPTYKRRRALLGAFYQRVNAAFAKRATNEARRVSRYNIDDLFPGELVAFDSTANQYAEFDPAPDVAVRRGRDPNELMPSEEVPDGTPPVSTRPAEANAIRQVSWQCIFDKQLFTKTESFNVWFRRTGQNPQYFVWRVKAPATRALMFDSLLGPNAIPEMKAVAVAHPVGGWIERGESEYITKMVRVARVMSNAAGRIIDSAAKTGGWFVTH